MIKSICKRIHLYQLIESVVFLVFLFIYVYHFFTALYKLHNQESHHFHVFCVFYSCFVSVFTFVLLIKGKKYMLYWIKVLLMLLIQFWFEDAFKECDFC